MHLPSEGTRLSHLGYLGTIRYVGRVDGTPGMWLGVEWDDHQRGKHDGVKDGKRYFNCQYAKDSASFIRPSSSINYGVTFLDALTSKYIEPPHGSESQEKVILGSSQGAIEVEAVGLDKIRGKNADLKRLREVSLDGENVAKCDAPGKIRATCPNIRGLDLSRSLLPDWKSVAAISQELPALERLALNQNRFQSLTSFLETHPSFLNLTDLQLNGTLATWDQMEEVTSMTPRLQVIEMGYNHLKLLSSSPRLTESTIQLINLDTNELDDWAHICHVLKPYSSLKRLILTSNLLDTISWPDDDQEPLRGLKHLALSFNRLHGWSDIDALHGCCPSLETLSLIGNPLLNVDHPLSRYARQFIVSKIPSLTALDSAAISAKERRDCELFYLSYISQHVSEDRRQSEHPRWRELCEKHGTPDEAPKRKEPQDKLSSRLIEVKIHTCFNPPPSETPAINALLEATSFTLRVLPTMSLRTFRLKILKTTKQNANQVAVKLWLKMGDGNLAELLENNDSHDLAWWGLETGSNIMFCVYPK